MGTVPAGPVGPDDIIDRIQPVCQYITRCPVGTDGMFSTSDSDQPTADGPVGRFITHSPVGLDRMLSTCDPDRPVADGPVGQSFILGPVGPRSMFSLYELNSASGCWQWASRLQPARWAHMRWYLTVSGWIG